MGLPIHQQGSRGPHGPRGPPPGPLGPLGPSAPHGPLRLGVGASWASLSRDPRSGDAKP